MRWLGIDVATVREECDSYFEEMGGYSEEMGCWLRINGEATRDEWGCSSLTEFCLPRIYRLFTAILISDKSGVICR